MKKSKLPYKQMIFVCTNARAPGERISCGGEGRCGPLVLEKLKSFVKGQNLETQVRVAKSGCQEKCEIGPNVVLLPQNEMISGLSEKDAEILIQSYLAPLI